MNLPIPIVIDDRERANPLPDELARTGVFAPEVKRLALGDYLVDGRFLFERKTLPDLALSIQDGRLFGQALRLAGSPLRAALILEGTAADLGGLGMRWEAMQGALVTVALFIGLPLLRCRTPAETARTFEFVARQGRAAAGGALPRRGRRPRGKAACQRYLLQGLPGVGPARAARLLERFGSVEAVVAADVGALAAVPGIGRNTARALRWAVEEPRADYDVAAAGPATSNTAHSGISMPSRVAQTSLSSAATTVPLS